MINIQIEQPKSQRRTLTSSTVLLEIDTPVNWPNSWWRIWITTTVQMMTKREIQFFTTINISQWPDPSLLFQFHILQIFWSTFQSLLQPLLHFSSAKCFMEPSSFDPLEICPTPIAKASWNTICKKENINQAVNLWFSCKPHRSRWPLLVYPNHPFPWPAKSEAFFSGELYWKNFWCSCSQKRILS